MVYGRIDINMSIYFCFGSKNNAAARKPIMVPCYIIINHMSIEDGKNT
jgi:hypothetical protein